MNIDMDSRADTSIQAALLARVAAGERSAFEALYRTSSGSLFGICLRVLADRGQAEEALQEAYVSIWNKAAQFDPSRASASAWLGSIARNRSIDRLRADTVARTSVSADFAEHIATDAASPVDEAEAAGDRSRLDECLRRLDARQRSLIRNAFFDASTYEELAHQIQAPLGSVKSWIRRGLMQLRACLES